MRNNNNQEDIYSNIEKRIQTTMIGALAKFEENFGHLWGIDKNDDLTDKELYFNNLWEKTRVAILNNGNNQLRNALGDLQKALNNNGTRAKYHYKFYMNPNSRNNQGDYRDEN